MVCCIVRAVLLALAFRAHVFGPIAAWRAGD